MFHFAPHRGWPELVFHVLAHVRSTAHLPASVYDEVYVAFVKAHAGPASERALAEDVQVLGAALPSHESLARVQLTAQLFTGVDEAVANASTDLHALDGTQPGLAKALAPVAQAAELLRCAALLEASTLDSLPAIALPEETMNAALAEVLAASPRLSSHLLVPLRALRLRGRLLQDEIWLGVPSDELELEPSHVAWQAAHEASVGEVSRAAHASGSESSEREIEHVAVVLMTERANSAGVSRAHRRWLDHLAEIPEPSREALSSTSRALLEGLRSSDAAV